MRGRKAFTIGLMAAVVALAALALALAVAPAGSKPQPEACLGGASSIEAIVEDGTVRVSAPAATGCTP